MKVGIQTNSWGLYPDLVRMLNEIAESGDAGIKALQDSCVLDDPMKVSKLMKNLSFGARV